MRARAYGGEPGVASLTHARVPIATAKRVSRKFGRLGAIIAGAVAALAIGASAATAQNAIGTAVGVTPAATGELGGNRVTLINGNDLYQGQIIATDTGGEVQIIFVDDTRMVVGPNSILQIETYLLRNANTLENFTANALGGTFRFITGTSPHEAYTINTPTGTIGVRGTAFDFNVALLIGVWEVNVLVYDGIVVMCALNGTCAELNASCEMGTIVPTLAMVIDPATAQQIARQSFPYARFQFWLRQELRVQNPRGCLFQNTRDNGGDANIESSDSSSGSGGSGGANAESSDSNSGGGSEGGGESSSSTPPCPSYHFQNAHGGKSGGPPWWYPADCYETKAMSPLQEMKLLFLLGRI
ncbi:MAG: FecR domain-containing protein [Bauldia sp.]